MRWRPPTPQYLQLEKTVAMLMVFGHQARSEVLSWTVREVKMAALGVAWWSRKREEARQLER